MGIYSVRKRSLFAENRPIDLYRSPRLRTTPEIGGLTVQQELEIIRGLPGLQLVGTDLVEVSPPYDPQGTTALVAANLAFKMLCGLPGVLCRDRRACALSASAN
jgi:arginase family protein